MKNNDILTNYVRELLLILAGGILYGISMIFLENITTIPGNLMGIACTLNTLLDWPTGLVNLALSIPTIIIGTIVIGKKMLIYTALTMSGVSLMTDLFTGSFSLTLSCPSIIPTLAAAVIMGIGCGLILFAGATTGGTTILARLVLLRFDKLSLGTLLILMDGIIILCGGLAIGDPMGLINSVIFEIVTCKVIDLVVMLLKRYLPASW